MLAKHTKSFNLIDTLSVAWTEFNGTSSRLQRQVETWRKTQITDDTAKLIFYSAFIDGKLEAPRSLLPEVHRLYFEPQYPEFSARTMWSLSNALPAPSRSSIRCRSSKRRPSWEAFSRNCRHSKLGLRSGGHHPERVRLIPVRRALGDPDPFRYPGSPLLDREDELLTVAGLLPHCRQFTKRSADTGEDGRPTISRFKQPMLRRVVQVIRSAAPPSDRRAWRVGPA